MATNEEIKTKIDALRLEKEQLVLARAKNADACMKAVESLTDTEEYKALDKKQIELRGKSSDAYSRKDECFSRISDEFVSASPRWRHPSWSSANGKNINERTIRAIKKAFQFSKLSGSAIEQIVTNMISVRAEQSKEYAALCAECERISKEEEGVRVEITRLTHRTHSIFDVEDTRITDRMGAIQDEIDQLGSELDFVSVKKSDMDGMSRRDKETILEDYRHKCKIEFMKVLAIMDAEEKQGGSQ